MIQAVTREFDAALSAMSSIKYSHRKWTLWLYLYYSNRNRKLDIFTYFYKGKYVIFFSQVFKIIEKIFFFAPWLKSNFSQVFLTTFVPFRKWLKTIVAKIPTSESYRSKTRVRAIWTWSRAEDSDIFESGLIIFGWACWVGWGGSVYFALLSSYYARAIVYRCTQNFWMIISSTIRHNCMRGMGKMHGHIYGTYPTSSSRPGRFCPVRWVFTSSAGSYWPDRPGKPGPK